MTRRGFIRRLGGLGLAGIIAAGRVPAAIVRSALGSRGIDNCEAAGDWQNPYVTEGLIAQWDGEWNVGGGMHDEGATIWADLSGNGCHIIPSQLDGYAIGYNCIDMASGCYFAGNLPKVYTRVTTEFCGCFTETYTQSTGCDMGVLVAGRAVGSFQLTAISNSSNDLLSIVRGSGDITSNLRSSYIKVGPVPPNAVSAYVNNITTFSGTGRAGGGEEVRFSVNGIKREGSGVTYWTAPGSVMETGIQVGSISGKTNIRLYSVRLYSRWLTNGEVVYNYGIDQARFGI